MAYYGTQHQQSYSEYDMSNPRAPPVPPPHQTPPSSFEGHRAEGNTGYPMGDRHTNSPAENPYSTDGYDSYHTPSSSHPNDSNIDLGPTQADDSGYSPAASYNKNNSRSHKRPGSISERKLVSGYDSDEEEDMPEKPKKKRSCLGYLCCACCTCFPMWLRWLCCGCFLIIIALAAAFGVLAAMFKTPTVNFLGTSQSPQFSVNGTSWTISTQLNIEVINPNIEHITFSDVKAVAYYPTASGKSHSSVGGGDLHNVHINSQATTNISFPFQINYNPEEDTDQAILSDIVTKCGLLGGTKTPLTVDYDLTLTIKLFFITFAPTISEKATFDCPIQVRWIVMMLGVRA
ncbi:hypothetical protein BC937DRAFT_95408, partial [Endogone sp. FLAS-F59071]